MTDDHTRGDSPQEGPADRGAAGDVSTTGHSGRETGGFSTETSKAGPTTGHAAHVPDPHQHGAHDDLEGDHDDHGHSGGGHGGHDDDAADVPTIVPTTWRQLIFPALILLLVAILVAGPITNAFQSRPAPATIEHNGTEPGTGPTSEPQATPESHGSLQTPAVASTPSDLSPVAVAPTAPPTPSYDAAATKTAVALAATQGTVARAPVQLQFGGTSFVVKAGDTLLPDWRPPQDQGIATWLQGSVANHIMYLPYSPENAALFQEGRKGDKLTLLMNTGQLFEFEITRSERAFNGPTTEQGQFTVTTAMAQDHAGVTLFLIGESTKDRAVVQADFTGNIQ
ncbi:MAG TPA: hypothetical protein VJ183_02395 [Chloroflexia bacterium]|nr:hypothetical protein [Chloroflexia bacterium]